MAHQDDHSLKKKTCQKATTVKFTDGLNSIISWLFSYLSYSVLFIKNQELFWNHSEMNWKSTVFSYDWVKSDLPHILLQLLYFGSTSTKEISNFSMIIYFTSNPCFIQYIVTSQIAVEIPWELYHKNQEQVTLWKIFIGETENILLCACIIYLCWPIRRQGVKTYTVQKINVYQWMNQTVLVSACPGALWEYRRSIIIII